MTVIHQDNAIFCLSTDTKPTTGVRTNRILVETDTFKLYRYNGTSWDFVLPVTLDGRTLTTAILTTPSITNQVATTTIGTSTAFPTVIPSSKRKASWFGHSQSTVDGMWIGFSTAIAVLTGTGFGIVIDSSGLRYRWDTNLTVNSLAGLRINSTRTTARVLNPWTEFKITLNQITDCRCFFGLISNTTAPASGADPLNALSGILFGYDSAVDGNWHIYQNSGSGASDSTTIANVAAAGTAIHTFALRADGTNSKFQYSYDGAAWVDIVTKIPAQTTILGHLWWIENLTGASKTFEMWSVKTFSD